MGSFCGAWRSLAATFPTKIRILGIFHAQYSSDEAVLEGNLIWRSFLIRLEWTAGTENFTLLDSPSPHLMESTPDDKHRV
jgi:hypothetical protein